MPLPQVTQFFTDTHSVPIDFQSSTFPAHIRGLAESAVQAGRGYLNSSGAGKAWPQLASSGPTPGQSSNRLRIDYDASIGPDTGQLCPNGLPLHAALFTDLIEYTSGARYPTITMFGRSGCGGGQDTFGSLQDPPIDLFNLFTHEMGHALGLGHNACQGSLMNIDLLYQGNTLGLTDEDCDLLDRLFRLVELGGMLSGSEQGEVVRLAAEVRVVLETRRQVLTKLRPGDFQFSKKAPKGATYEVSFESISSSQKSCVASNNTGTIEDSPIQDIQVTCSCNTPLAGGDCDDPDDPDDQGLLERILISDIRPDLCTRLPHLCRSSNVPWWWAIPGPPSGPGAAPCRRQTECRSNGQICGDFDDDGMIECAEKYECRDRCIEGASIFFEGPAMRAHVSSQSADELEVAGFLRDLNGISGVAFMIDYEVVDPIVPLSLGEVSPLCPDPGDPECGPSVMAFSARLNIEGLSSGAHAVQILALDDEDLYPFPSAIEVPFDVGCGDDTPPFVNITEPALGSAVSGQVTVRANATDDGEVARVDFLVDGQDSVTDLASPYTFDWNSTALADGDHTLRARATDACGNTSLSSVVGVVVSNANPPPSLYVAMPVAGESLSGEVVISGWATDADGVPRQGGVTLRLDGQNLPLTQSLTWVARPDVCAAQPVGDPFCPAVGWRAIFDSTAFADGSHTLGVSATNGSSTVSVTRQITFDNENEAPALEVGWPSQQQILSGANVVFEGWAADSDGVTSIQFLVDGAPLSLNAPVERIPWGTVCQGQGAGDPDCPNVGWRAFFDTRQHADGMHQLRVTVSDGVSESSKERSVHFNNNPQGVTRAYVAIADSFAQQAAPDSASGGPSPDLSARSTASGSGRNAILKFEISGLTGPVTSARLVLTESQDLDIPEIRLWRVDDPSWSESTFTWNNLPTSYQQHSVAYDLEKSSAHEFDVTSLVIGNGMVSIALTTTVDQDFFVASREHPTSNWRPRLVVTSLP